MRATETPISHATALAGQEHAKHRQVAWLARLAAFHGPHYTPRSWVFTPTRKKTSEIFVGETFRTFLELRCKAAGDRCIVGPMLTNEAKELLADASLTVLISALTGLIVYLDVMQRRYLRP